jgi:transcriptional regulator with XRE-family HTH domain
MGADEADVGASMKKKREMRRMRCPSLARAALVDLIARRAKIERAPLGMYRKALVAKFHVSLATLARWERGELQPTILEAQLVYEWSTQIRIDHWLEPEAGCDLSEVTSRARQARSMAKTAAERARDVERIEREMAKAGFDPRDHGFAGVLFREVQGRIEAHPMGTPSMARAWLASVDRKREAGLDEIEAVVASMKVKK